MRLTTIISTLQTERGEIDEAVLFFEGSLNTETAERTARAVTEIRRSRNRLRLPSRPTTSARGRYYRPPSGRCGACIALRVPRCWLHRTRISPFLLGAFIAGHRPSSSHTQPVACQRTKRIVMPLSVDEVARFWSSFRTSRDLAIVGLMNLQGLRLKEVIALNCEDVLPSESKIRVLGKGNKICILPWLPTRSCYWTTTCDWNGPSTAARRCSSR